MPYLIAILVSLALFSGFLLMTALEARSRRLILPVLRERLDVRVARGAYIARHVDWGAFLDHLVREGAAIIAHDLAHATLLVVRFIERTLSRIVRALRERRAETPVRRPRGERMTLRTFVRSFRKREPDA